MHKRLITREILIFEPLLNNQIEDQNILFVRVLLKIIILKVKNLILLLFPSNYSVSIMSIKPLLYTKS